MGVVYLGRDQSGGLVAVKVAQPWLLGDEEVRARFRAEVACLRRVPAHCTARLLVDGTAQPWPHLVTEYVAGRSLKDIVDRDGPLPPEQLRAMATGVIRALAGIHQAGLVHRDLKPANVLLTATGPRVIDFGIAQEVAASGGPTGTGMVVGSIGWIAPERLSRRPATPASDIFGWGCLVAYAGTARNPFGTGDADEVARRAIFGHPDLDGLDTSLRPLVAAALAKAPADRPAAERLLARLSPADPGAEGEPSPPAETSTAPLDHGRRRRRTLAAASAVMAVAATVTAWITAVGGQTASEAGDRPLVQRTGGGPAATETAVIIREPVTAHSAPPSSRPVTRRPAFAHDKPGGAGKAGHGKKHKGGHAATRGAGGSR
jgi:serine/threonine protein kinase